MLKKLISTLVFVLLLCGKTSAQNYDAQRTQVLLTNLISNAIMGGVGGAINKGKDEKLYKAFIRNFIKGGIGGLIKYNAKYQAYGLNSSVSDLYAPINRLYFFLGHSFVVNASLNRKMLDTYYCNFYGVDLRVNLAAEQKIRARLSLATVGSAAFFALKGFQLDGFRTLTYGQLFFIVPNNPEFGQATFNCIAIESSGARVNSYIIPHEVVHTYQQYDYFAISSFYHNDEEALFKKNKTLNFLSNYLVADYQAGFFSALYLCQPQPAHFKNYFEFEAQHFQTRNYVRR